MPNKLVFPHLTFSTKYIFFSFSKTLLMGIDIVCRCTCICFTLSMSISKFTLFWARAEESFLVGVVYGELWNMLLRGDSWLAMEELLLGGVVILEVITDSFCWEIWLFIEVFVLKKRKPQSSLLILILFNYQEIAGKILEIIPILYSDNWYITYASLLQHLL